VADYSLKAHELTLFGCVVVACQPTIRSSAKPNRYAVWTGYNRLKGFQRKLNIDIYQIACHYLYKLLVFFYLFDSTYFLKLSRIACHPALCCSSEFVPSASKDSTIFTLSPSIEKSIDTALSSDIL
jgi:hypothetical protein